jgi:hypothetical protein
MTICKLANLFDVHFPDTKGKEASAERMMRREFEQD